MAIRSYAKEIDLDDEIDVIITSYGVLRRDAEMLSERQFRYIILDEAQSAKNAASQNATAIRQLKSERRLALTGTPIENRLEELWTTLLTSSPQDFWAASDSSETLRTTYLAR